MLCDARLFGPQIEALSSICDIVVPELVQPSIAEMASHVLNLIPDRQFNLAGLSMGGIVAMQIVAAAPERVARLALLDTNHHADLPQKRRVRDRQIADVRNGRLRDVVTDEMKPNYLAKGNSGNRALLALLIEMAMDCGEETFIAQSLALRDRGDMSNAISSYKGTSLVLCGEEDRLCPPVLHQSMKKILDHAELIHVHGAGHISTLENPGAVTSALAAWLQRPVR